MWQPTIVWVFPFKLSEKCLTDPIWVPQIYWQTGTLYSGSIKKTNEIDGCMLNQKSTFFKISPFIQNSSLKCMSFVFCQQMQKGIIGEFSIPICPCFPRRLPCYVFCICLLLMCWVGWSTSISCGKLFTQKIKNIHAKSNIMWRTIFSISKWTPYNNIY